MIKTNVAPLSMSAGEYGLFALLDRARHMAITEMSTRPRLYYTFRTITGRRDYRCIRNSTEIVIEGYPRSANSSTVQEFLDRQNRPIEIAHHTHHVAQLLRAVEQRIPAVMLIRPPTDAIQSHLALIAEVLARGGRRGRAASLVVEDLAWTWLRFYAPLIPHRKALVIGQFEQVTNDVPGLIRRINERFGTSFGTIRRRETSLGYHAFPNPVRSELKRQVAEHLAARSRASARFRRLLEDCERIYDVFRDTDECYEARRCGS